MPMDYRVGSRKKGIINFSTVIMASIQLDFSTKREEALYLYYFVFEAGSKVNQLQMEVPSEEYLL